MIICHGYKGVLTEGCRNRKGFLAGGGRSLPLPVHQAAGGDRRSEFPPAGTGHNLMGASEPGLLSTDLGVDPSFGNCCLAFENSSPLPSHMARW